MNKVLVLPYKTASESATAVSGILNCMKMKVEGSRIRNLATTTIVNWGNSTTDLSRLTSVKIFNNPTNVRTASHKLEFFQAISAANEGASLPVCIPDWTTSVIEARDWYSSGHDVVCRHVMQGHSGDGIELVNYKEHITATSAVPNAPLYTKYVKKRDEYRVHVVKGTAIFVQRKGREVNNQNPINYQIRNRVNGFIFLTQDLNPHKTVISEAVNTVNALGLDFGAVDVIWNERRKVATVLEVNTACGLTSPLSKQRYTVALNTMIAGVGKQISWQQATDSNEELTYDPSTYRVQNRLRGTNYALSTDASSLGPVTTSTERERRQQQQARDIHAQYAQRYGASAARIEDNVERSVAEGRISISAYDQSGLSANITSNTISGDSSASQMQFYRNSGTGPELTATIGNTTEDEVQDAGRLTSAESVFTAQLDGLGSISQGALDLRLSTGDYVLLSADLINAMVTYSQSNPPRSSFRLWGSAVAEGITLTYQVQGTSSNGERLYIRFKRANSEEPSQGFTIAFPRNQLRLVETEESVSTLPDRYRDAQQINAQQHEEAYFIQRLGILVRETINSMPHRRLRAGDPVVLSPTLITLVDNFSLTPFAPESFRNWRRMLTQPGEISYQVHSASGDTSRVYITYSSDNSLAAGTFRIPFPRNQLNLIQPRD